MANVVLKVQNEPEDLPLALTTLKKQFSNSNISELVRDQADDLLHQLTAYIDSIPKKYNYTPRNNNESKRRLYETSDIVIRELERLSKFVKDKKQFTETMEFLKKRIEDNEKQAFLNSFARIFGGKRRKTRMRKTGKKQTRRV